MSRTTAFLALIVVALAAYLLGSRSPSVPAPPTAGPPAQPVAGAQEVAASGDAVGAAPDASPSQAKRMDQSAFWGLIADTRAAADGDTGRQSELLEQRLRALPPRQIVAFARIRQGLDERAYTWNLWGAAYVIEDGCSDDCFRDFRAYLISLGRGPYEAALRNPDSLAPIVQDPEKGDWENADNVTADAYSGATGDDAPFDDTDLSGNPSGEPWDDDQAETLVRRYPRLAARFR